MFRIHKTAENAYALEGDLDLDSFMAADARLKEIGKKAAGSFRLDGAALQKIDTAGALVLAEVRRNFPQVQFDGFSAEHQSFLALIEKTNPPDPVVKRQVPSALFYVERLGHGAVRAFDAAKDLLGFFGQVMVFGAKNLRHPRHFRWGSLSRHIQETGIDAMPIVALVAFLISLVLAYQGVFQLRPLGAESFTVNLVAVSVLREMGVLLTAIMVAGRSGSAFTAEIGVMKVNEEVDALSMIGIEPFDILVLPRLFALLITLPLLTFMADIVGLFGGAVTCSLVLNTSWQQYWEQVRQAVQGTDFMVGLLKAPVFALIIAVVGCKFGMQVSGSAESVGTYTTKSVVESIFIVLVADAIFSVMFSKIGW